MTPAWYDFAVAEIGVSELPGKLNNSGRIMEYFAAAGRPDIPNDEVAWCSAFMCAVMEWNNIDSPKTLWARDWLRWGVPIRDPVQGAVVVFQRNGNFGHVALFDRWEQINGKWMIRCLGGNQSNKVCFGHYDPDLLLGVRWPAGNKYGQRFEIPGAPRPVQPPPAEPPPLPDAWAPTISPPQTPAPPIPVQEAPAVPPIDYLRSQGSRTIQTTDSVQSKAKTFAGANFTALLAAVVTAVMGIYEQLSPLLPLIGLTALALASFGFAAYVILRQRDVQQFRADDHVNGLHIGRRNDEFSTDRR